MFTVTTGLLVTLSLLNKVSNGDKYYDEMMEQDGYDYQGQAEEDYDYDYDYEYSYEGSDLSLDYDEFDMDELTNENLQRYDELQTYATQLDADDDDLDWAGLTACNRKKSAEFLQFIRLRGGFVLTWTRKCLATPLSGRTACWRQRLAQIRLFDMSRINSHTAWTEACSYIFNPSKQAIRIQEMYDAYKKENDKIGLTLMKAIAKAIRNAGYTPPNSIRSLDDDSDSLVSSYNYYDNDDESVCTDSRDVAGKICGLVCQFIPSTWRWICTLVCRAIHAIWTLVCTAIDFTDVNTILQAVKEVLNVFGSFPVAQTVITGVQNLLTAIGVSPPAGPLPRRLA